MDFERLIKIPMDRIGVLIGKFGTVKLEIEKKCFVILKIDSSTGEVSIINSKAQNGNIGLFKAIEIITAIGRGFSSFHAMQLLKDEKTLCIIDLKNFAGKSPSKIERIKSRIIGENGRAKKNIENLTDTDISVYGKTVSIIGNQKNIKLIINTITLLSNGCMHHTVYNKLEIVKRQIRFGKLQLWEDQNELW